MPPLISFASPHGRIVMIESSHATHPSPYTAPTPRPSRPTRFVILTAINAVAAVASLLLVPLAAHIYSCASGPKWCHVQAIVLGVPSALVWGALFIITATMTLSSRPLAQCSKRLNTAAWSLLAFARVVLGALFGAVAYDSL